MSIPSDYQIDIWRRKARGAPCYLQDKDKAELLFTFRKIKKGIYTVRMLALNILLNGHYDYDDRHTELADGDIAGCDPETFKILTLQDLPLYINSTKIWPKFTRLLKKG